MQIGGNPPEDTVGDGNSVDSVGDEEVVSLTQVCDLQLMGHFTWGECHSLSLGQTGEPENKDVAVRLINKRPRLLPVPIACQLVP